MAGSSKEMELAIKIAGKVDSSLGKSFSSVNSKIAKIGSLALKATGIAAGVVAAIGGAAVKVGKEFESSMSQVYATMGVDKSSAEGQKTMETLEKAARDMGKSTAFSASEAAEGLNYLALAGYSADEAATALPYTLKLAGAGAMELGAASDMVTDAMAALNLEANETNLSTFSDQLAKTATKTNTSVSQLGEAILTVGGTAANLAGGTSELNAALGILANVGIKGAEGGTKLRNMITSLQSPTDKAAGAMKELGLQVYDQQGNMRSLNDIFSDMNTAMAGMTNAEKDNLLSSMFNKRDLAAARAMMSGAGEEFANLQATIQDSAGATDQMYATQLDNLEGDISIFKSALSDLGIGIYENIGGGVRDAVQLGTECLGDLSAAFEEGGLAGMVGEVGNVLSKIIDYIMDLAPEVLGAAIDLITNLISGLNNSADKIGSVVIMLISQFMQGWKSAMPILLELASNLIIALADSLVTELPTMIDTFLSNISQVGDKILEILPHLLDAGVQLLMALAQGIVQALPQLIQIVSQILVGFFAAINTCLPQLLQAGIQILMALLQGLIQALPQIIQSVMQVINYFVMCVLQNLPIILSAGFQLLWALVNGIMNNLDMIISAAITLIGQLIAGLLQNLPLLISCAIQLIVALAAGLIQAIPQLIAVIPQIIIAIVNAFTSTDWSGIGKDIINGIKDGLNAMKDSLIDTAKNIWNSIKSVFSKKVETNVSVSGGATQHAAGGIFSQATLLPSVNGSNHIVGEAGPEAILPLQALWDNLSATITPGFTTVNDKLNVLANKLLTNGSANSSSDNNAAVGGAQPQIVFSPQITIQGNANKEDVENAMTMSMQKFEEMYNRMMKQRQRVAF